MSSLAGISKYGIEYGGSPSHNVLCDAIAKFATEPKVDLLEYLKRDIANIALGNKDNHPRNKAVFRHEDSRVELTPLYDFAPMYLDPQGIARTCRWEGEVGRVRSFIAILGEPSISSHPAVMPNKIFSLIMQAGISLLMCLLFDSKLLSPNR